MSSKTHRYQRKEMKNLPVTSRCVAIVFSPGEIFCQKTGESESPSGQRLSGNDNRLNFNPKNVLEDFKVRNKNCYWNPALVESVKSLEYVGFLEPYTILVKGDDIHLENVRTAWGRRVLKDPADFHIDRIGDVNGIQMQIIPQTQFIPLPEALCLIIMDLNNNQIVATLDTVCEKLQFCYQGHHLPSNQLVYDTLGTLIRERKVFHTGFGYFVVTPDTFRLHAEDQLATTWNTAWTHLHPMYIPAAFSQPQRAPMRSISCQVDVMEEKKPAIGQNESGDLTEVGLPNRFGYFVVTPDTFRLHAEDQLATTWNTAWTHLHPMYIPAAFSQPQRAPMRSISCQVDVMEEKKPAIGQNESGDLTEVGLPNSNAIQVDLPPPRLQRSMSLSVRRPRERDKKDDLSDGGLKRSSSVKGRSESKGDVITRYPEEKKEQKADKQKVEKTSLFAKLFGRNKKKVPPTPPPPPAKPAVEYATFSAQFPPPEWTWYQQQLEKHIRTESWVQQQVVKSGTWHHFQNIQQDIQVDGHAQSERGTMPAGSYQAAMKQDIRDLDGDKIKKELKRHSSRSKGRHKEKPAMVIANRQRDRLASDTIVTNVPVSTSMENPGPRLRLSSLPTRLSPPGATNLPHSDDIHPMFNSTPRYMSSYQNQYDFIDNTVNQIQKNTVVDPCITGKRNSARKSHRSKRRSHQEYPSGFNPVSQNEDVTCEYRGRLPKKNHAIGMSRDSGVNCVGLESGHNEVREHKPRAPKPSYYKETEVDHDLAVRNFCDQLSSDQINSCQEKHIYANVQIANPASHSSSRRVSEKPARSEKEKQRRSASYRYYKSDKRKQNQNPLVERLNLESHIDSCATELHKLCTETSEKMQSKPVSSQEKGSHDSAVEGTCSSEHSLGTVIDAIALRRDKTPQSFVPSERNGVTTKAIKHKQVDNLITETQHSFGDSGFSSPRVSEMSSDSKKSDGSSNKNEIKTKIYEKISKSEHQSKANKHDSKRSNSDTNLRGCESGKNDSNLLREKQSLMCNNIKNAKTLNNSVSDLDTYSSDTAFGTINPDALYENVKLDHAEVLNNMQYLHKEITVSSQNLNKPQPDVTAEAVEAIDIKKPVIGKFKLEGDFHVVGVV